MLTKDTLFKPSKSESRADETTRTARGIIEAEAAARTEKLRRLRGIRLEQAEAEKAAAVAKTPAKRTRKKPEAQPRA